MAELCRTCLTCSLHVARRDSFRCGGCKKVNYCSKECQKDIHRHTISTAYIKILHGILTGPEPASKRISWGSWNDTDPDTLRVIEYARTLDTDCINRHALRQWLIARSRAAIFYDLIVPTTFANGYSQIDAFLWNAVQETRDRSLQEKIRDYDPAVESCIFIYLVNPDTSPVSLRIWQLPSSCFSKPPTEVNIFGQTLSGRNLRYAIQKLKEEEQGAYEIWTKGAMPDNIKFNDLIRIM